MLKQPDSYRERAISERISALVEYVNHVNAVMWRQQEAADDLPDNENAQ